MIFYDLRPRPLSQSGEIMPGCYYQFYESGTTTPTPVYADAELTTPLANPLVADSDGRFPVIYTDDSVVYRVQLYDESDVLQYDADPVHPHSSVPPGTVVMFHGDSTERDAAYPPALWEVCDGDGGTPDTRDRSPIGVSNTKDIGDVGGSATATTDSAGAHDHGGATSETVLSDLNLPVHHHLLWACTGTNSSENTLALGAAGSAIVGDNLPGTGYLEDNGSTNQLVQDAGTADPDGHDHDITEAAAHTHDVATQSPWFAVWFLKRKASV